MTEAARVALSDATHAVFVAIVPLAAAVLVLSFLLPEHPLRTHRAPTPDGETLYAARSSRGARRATCSRRSRTSGSSASSSARSHASRQSRHPIGAGQRVRVARPGGRGLREQLSSPARRR